MDRTRFDQLTTRFTESVIRWRWPVVLLTILIVGAIGSGGRGLFFDNDYRAFFSDENPQLTAFEELQDVYTKNDNILFVVAPKDGNGFSRQNLKAVEELTAGAWTLPFTIRVDAVTNFQHTIATEDDLIVEDLVLEPANRSDRELSFARSVALNEPLLLNRLIDPDAKVIGVNATLQLPGENISEVPEAAAAARVLAESIKAKYPDSEIYHTGVAELNNAFMSVSQNEMSRLLPIMFAAMFLIMILSLRSVSGTIVTLLLIVLSVIVGMGFGGFMKIGLTPPSAQAPTIIMTLAVADSIHILVTMLRNMAKGMAKREAIVEAARINMGPVFLTSLSTVIGFLSMNFSDVPPFNHLGNITAIGVTAAFILSVTFLPALAAILPFRVKQTTETKLTFVDRLAEFVIAKRKPLLIAAFGITVVFVALIPMNVLDDRFVEYFDERVEFRQHTDFISENLSGIYQIEYSLDGGEANIISDPAYLHTVDEFAKWFRAQPGVVHVNTYTDIMKRLNKSLHADDESYYTLPANREEAAQYLLLYEMSLPYGLDLNNQINVSRSSTRFTVTMENIATTEISALTASGEKWLRDNAPEELYSTGSGPIVMFANISGINISSMIRGSTLALIVISLLMIIALKSIKLGLISFLPNLMPVAIAFGIWALLSGVVNMGLSIVIGMTLGIVVDDSIHFLSKYKRARNEQNLSSEDAVRYAFSSVGRALIVTSAILVVGFLILSTSVFQMNSSMGLLTAITIAIALIVDFLFLPPLLILLDRDKSTATADGDAILEPTV